MKKHYTIPFFIPHEGCPHQCVFCDQNSITAQTGISPRDVPEKIERYLATIPRANAEIDAGFFGGSFTGLPPDVQKSFLDPVQEYIKEGKVRGIRLSTRPDLISEEILMLLKSRGVVCIELGVQSMSEKVLLAAKRGHTAGDVERASGMILRHGFELAHQMMLGLPLSTEEDEYFTARRARELGACQVRIYPLVVIKETELSVLWRDGAYLPITEEEAVKRSVILILYFTSNGINVIRCGLHPSEGLLSGESILAGPFHQAFRQKAESRIFSILLDRLHDKVPGTVMRISFNPEDEAAFFGFEKENSRKIKKITGGEKGSLKRDASVPRGCITASGEGHSVSLDRRSLAQEILPEMLRDSV